MKINQLCKFILFYLGSWLIFIWEVGSFTTFAPSSVLLTSPHIIEVVREAYATKSTAHRRHAPRHRRPQQSHTKTPLNPHD